MGKIGANGCRLLRLQSKRDPTIHCGVFSPLLPLGHQRLWRCSTGYLRFTVRPARERINVAAYPRVYRGRKLREIRKPRIPFRYRALLRLQFIIRSYYVITHSAKSPLALPPFATILINDLEPRFRLVPRRVLITARREITSCRGAKASRAEHRNARGEMRRKNRFGMQMRK